MSMFNCKLMINPTFLDDKVVAKLKCAYGSSATLSFVENGCHVFKLPFPCCAFDDFLQTNMDSPGPKSSAHLIDKLELEARRLPFTRSRNDMYVFNQSVDIANLVEADNPNNPSLLVQLRSFLLSDVLPWLKEVTGAELNEGEIDFTASRYDKNDFLLCHDDQLEYRRIAFILYLVADDWDAKRDGGALDLFSCQPEGSVDRPPSVNNEPSTPINPWRITNSVPPKRNRFAFFEPSAYSFHQVAEILGVRDRLSVHGWFHGPALSRPVEKSRSIPIPLVPPMHVEEELVYRWINPLYLDMVQQSKIRRRFSKSSEIQLTNFLKAEQWQQLCQCLTGVRDSNWLTCGPYNRRHFKNFRDLSLTNDSTNSVSIPVALRELHSLFRSEALLVILSDLTGLELHPCSLKSTEQCDGPDTKRPCVESNGTTEKITNNNKEPSVTDSVRISDPQLRRWCAGNYTLLADSDVTGTDWRLECTLHLGGYGPLIRGDQADTEKSVAGWQADWGGQIVYIAKDEKDELLTVTPLDNALTLVYTGPGTASFVRYINHAAQFKPLSRTDESETTEPSSAQTAYDLSVIYYETSEREDDAPSNTSDDDSTSGDDDDSHVSDLGGADV